MNLKLGTLIGFQIFRICCRFYLKHTFQYQVVNSSCVFYLSFPSQFHHWNLANKYNSLCRLHTRKTACWTHTVVSQFPLTLNSAHPEPEASTLKKNDTLWAPEPEGRPLYCSSGRQRKKKKKKGRLHAEIIKAKQKLSECWKCGHRTLQRLFSANINRKHSTAIAIMRKC